MVKSVVVRNLEVVVGVPQFLAQHPSFEGTLL